MKGLVSITTTQRRRFFWCAWWTGKPSGEPFRRPDAFSGGAKSIAAALRDAEKAAGMKLESIEPVWARAFIRVQKGQTPWVEKKTPRRKEKTDRQPKKEPPKTKRFVPSVAEPRKCPFEVLGLSKSASAESIRKAYRSLVLSAHPDTGGDATTFIRLTWARDEATRRASGR